MTRIHLTLDSKYVPNWGMKEGLRELVQNWLDAGGRGRPTHADGKVVLDNPSATMNREVLLIGHSTKPGTGARGQFGEGLKLGTLALLRDGCSVTVETAGETWTAMLDAHPTLNRQVLAWDITPGATSPGVRVTVGGITGDDWASMRRTFIWDCDPTKSALLQNDNYRGAVYVKGIHVMDHPDLRFGYNIHNLKTDRDRKLVDNFELGKAASIILLDALSDGEVSGKDVLDAFIKESLETQHCAYDYVLDITGRQALTDAWTVGYENTIPCEKYDWGTAEKLRKLGKKARTVPDQLVKFLDVPDGRQVLKDLKGGRLPHITSAQEQRNLDWALEMVKHGLFGHPMPTVRVAKFMDNVAVVRDDETDDIYLSPSCLKTKATAVYQLAQATHADVPAIIDYLLKHNVGVTA